VRHAGKVDIRRDIGEIREWAVGAHFLFLPLRKEWVGEVT
jgi:hypothetical protein